MLRQVLLESFLWFLFTPGFSVLLLPSSIPDTNRLRSGPRSRPQVRICVHAIQGYWQGMAGARQDWGGMQAKAPRGWPQPDPMGCKCALGPPSTQLRQLQSPEDHARRNHRARFEAKAYQGLGAQDMVRRIRGVSVGGALAFSATSFTTEMLLESLCSHSKNEFRPQTENQEGTSLFLQNRRHTYPALPLRARVHGKGDTQSCLPEHPLWLWREATCGLFKPQASKPPGGLLVQGRREVRDPGDYRLARSLGTQEVKKISQNRKLALTSSRHNLLLQITLPSVLLGLEVVFKPGRFPRVKSCFESNHIHWLICCLSFSTHLGKVCSINRHWAEHRVREK